MKLRYSLLLASCLSLSGLTVCAEEIKVPVGEQGQSIQIKIPKKGMTQDRVKELFGEPLKMMAPVGEPPITRWEYEKFTVFFEYNITLHTVIKHKSNP